MSIANDTEMVYTESDVWNYIYREARKYVKGARIYIERSYIEYGVGLLSSLCAPNIGLPPIEAYELEKALERL